MCSAWMLNAKNQPVKLHVTTLWYLTLFWDLIFRILCYLNPSPFSKPENTVSVVEMPHTSFDLIIDTIPRGQKQHKQAAHASDW